MALKENVVVAIAVEKWGLQEQILLLLKKIERSSASFLFVRNSIVAAYAKGFTSVYLS